MGIAPMIQSQSSSGRIATYKIKIPMPIETLMIPPRNWEADDHVLGVPRAQLLWLPATVLVVLAHPFRPGVEWFRVNVDCAGSFHDSA